MTFTALPHQYQILTSKNPLLCLLGGVGSGKSTLGSIWTLKQIAEHPKSHGLIVANTYNQLTDATLANWFRQAESMGLPCNPIRLPRSRGPTTIQVGSAEILCRSLDHWEALSGIEVGWAWIDEAWDAEREAIELVLARIRGEGSRQLLVTSTPDDPSSFLHELATRPSTFTVVAPTSTNRHLPAGYVEGLRTAYSDELFRRMVQGEWISFAEGVIYKSFGEWNLAETKHDPSFHVVWSHDFNVAQGKPMSSCLLQVRNGEVHVLDEIVFVDGNLYDSINEAKARNYHLLPNLLVTGDASGRNKTHLGVSDVYALEQAGFHCDFPKANPEVRSRHNLVNALLRNAEGKSVLFIDKIKCPKTCEGLRTTKLKTGSHYVEDDSNASQHVTTALGYACCRYVQLPEPPRPWQHPAKGKLEYMSMRTR